MSNLNNRIYEELNEWKYTQCMLSRALFKEQKKRKYLNAFLIFFSICSVVGWFKYAELKLVWSLILILTQAIRIFQNIVLQSESELFSMKSSIDFYNFKIVELENLFYDFHSVKFKDSTIEKRLNNLRNDERNLFSRQNFDKVSSNNQMIKSSETETDNFLIKLKNNIL